MHALEQEVKLDTGPGWHVPDLEGVLPGSSVGRPEVLQLDAVYYDTDDAALGRHRMTLRLRSERVDGGEPVRQWTLKLPAPASGEVEARTEVNREVPEGPLSTPEEVPPGVPADISGLVTAATLGHHLHPVAHLSTVRERRRVTTSDGRLLAEVDHDSVTGTNLLLAARGHPAATVTFCEVEVELAPGAALETATAIVERLMAAGARRSDRHSKVGTVLERTDSSGRAGPGLSPGQAPDGAPGGRARELVRRQAGDCLSVLAQTEPYIKLGDPGPEHVHKARVATRRTRAVLRALARAGAARGQATATSSGAAHGAGAEGQLVEELQWLGQVLGRARDAEVRLGSLERLRASLRPEDSEGAEELGALARADHQAARADLVLALHSERYLGAVQALAAVAESPEAGGLAGPLGAQPARTVAAVLVASQWRSVRRALRAAAQGTTDQQLHRARIKTKQLRYLAELAGTTLDRRKDRRHAQETALLATDLQDLLGELHDSQVMSGWLARAAARCPAGAAPAEAPGPPPGDGAPGQAEEAVPDGPPTPAPVVAGLLLAAVRREQVDLGRRWPLAWKRLERQAPGRRARRDAGARAEH